MFNVREFRFCLRILGLLTNIGFLGFVFGLSLECLLLTSFEFVGKLSARLVCLVRFVWLVGWLFCSNILIFGYFVLGYNK